MKPRSPDYFTPKTLWAVGAFITLLAAVLSAGFHHYDEHYHTLEYVALKLGLTTQAELPWEYGAKIRSWLLPAIFFPIVKIQAFVGFSNPLTWSLSFRLLGALLNCAVMLALLNGLPTTLKHRRLAAATLCLLWFFPYVHVRTSIENWSGALFFLGVALYFNRWNPFLIGLLWTLAFQLRLQVAPLIVGATVWICVFDRNQLLRRGARFFLGTATALAMGAFIDRWGYGEWTVPWWNYLTDQFAHSRASAWGTAPPWYYLTESLLKGAPPLSIVLVGGVLLSWFWYPKSIWTWITVPFVVLHSLEPHKELRFLFPMLYAVPIQVAMAADKLQPTRLYRLLKSRVVFKLLVGLNLALLAWASLRPAEGRVHLFQFLQLHYPESTIHFTEDDPYSLFKMPLNFYRPPKLHTLPIDFSEVRQTLKNTGPLILVSIRFTIPAKYELDSLCVRRFSVLPLWIARFNFNQWTQRTRVWTVYECG